MLCDSSCNRCAFNRVDLSADGRLGCMLWSSNCEFESVACLWPNLDHGIENPSASISPAGASEADGLNARDLTVRYREHAGRACPSLVAQTAAATLNTNVHGNSPLNPNRVPPAFESDQMVCVL